MTNPTWVTGPVASGREMPGPGGSLTERCYLPCPGNRAASVSAHTMASFAAERESRAPALGT
eukprot:gene36146-333_t